MIISILFFISTLIIGSAVFLYLRRVSDFPVITILPLTIILIECFHAFAGGILTLLHIPVGLISIAILDLAAGFSMYVFLRLRPGKPGCITITRSILLDLLFPIVLFLIVLWFGIHTYGLPNLQWHYILGDPAQHLTWAMEFIDQKKVSGMFFSQVQNGLLLQFFSPWYLRPELYHIYIFGDLLQLFLSGFMFYGCIRCFVKEFPSQLAGFLFSFLYLLGYPLNSTLFGFSYLGMVLTLLSALLPILELVRVKEYPLMFWVFSAMLLFSVFVSYALFAPVIYLSAFLYLLLRKEKSLWKVLLLFLAPAALGFSFVWAGVFYSNSVNNYVQQGDTLVDALTLTGINYTDLYSNFLFLMPAALFSWYLLLRRRKQKPSMLLLLLPLHLIFMCVLFIAGTKYELISPYYYFKNQYLLWSITMLLLCIGFSVMEKEQRILSLLSIGSLFFVLLVGSSGIEERISGRSYREAGETLFDTPLLDSAGFSWVGITRAEDYSNLFFYNKAVSDLLPYPADYFELIQSSYDLVESSGEEIPVVSNETERLLYDALTGQKIIEESEWVQLEMIPVETLSSRYHYLCVYTDSILYQLYQPYFDSLEKIHSNSEGFLARL